MSANKATPTTKNGNLNPPHSNKIEPMIGPESIPNPVKVYVIPISLLTSFSKLKAIIEFVLEFKHPFPNPSTNLHKKDKIAYAKGLFYT